MAARGNTLSRGRADALVAAGVAAAAFALYLASLPPTFGFWDTAELQTVAAILGIAHPPGSPAFVLLGWVAVHALPFGEPAWRVNVLAALAVALSAGLAVPCARMLGATRATAALAACGFACASVAWRDATHADAQALALVFRAAAVACGLRFARTGERSALAGLGFATGLAGATHGIAVVFLPALALFVWARPAARNPRAFAFALACVALGLGPYAYVPLRSAYVGAHALDPTRALGLPVGMPVWDYDHPATLRGFVRLASGADFDVGSGFAGYLALARYPAFAAAAIARLADAFGFAGALLAAYGLVELARARRCERLAVVVAALATVPYTEAYASLQMPGRYYVFVLWCAALAIAVGFDRLAGLLALGARGSGRFVLAGALVASFVAAAPERADFFLQHDDRGGPAFVRDVVAHVPDGAVVVAPWAYAMPLAYAEDVDGSLGRRVVVPADPGQYEQYIARWLPHRAVYMIAFDSDLHVSGLTLARVQSGLYSTYRVLTARPSTPVARAGGSRT
jgi:hypothetical protein